MLNGSAWTDVALLLCIQRASSMTVVHKRACFSSAANPELLLAPCAYWAAWQGKSLWSTGGMCRLFKAQIPFSSKADLHFSHLLPLLHEYLRTQNFAVPWLQCPFTSFQGLCFISAWHFLALSRAKLWLCTGADEECSHPLLKVWYERKRNPKIPLKKKVVFSC